MSCSRALRRTWSAPSAMLAAPVLLELATARRLRRAECPTDGRRSPWPPLEVIIAPDG